MGGRSVFETLRFYAQFVISDFKEERRLRVLRRIFGPKRD
jgi:hypothetical protein